MRVCFVAQTYYSTHRLLIRNAKALLKQGYEVDVICLQRKGEKRKEALEGVNVHRLPLEHHRGGVIRYLFEYSAFFLMASMLLARLSVTRRYRLIEVYTMPDFLVFVTVIPRLLRAKVLLYMFENTPQIFMSSFGVGPKHPAARLMRFIEWASATYADRIIVADGLPYARILQSHGIPREKMTVVLNVPDNSVFSADQQKLPEEGPYFRLMVLSSLLPRYGVHTVIKAIPLLHAKITNLRVDVLGSGEYLPQLKKLAAELSVERYLNFIGFVAQELVPAYIDRADIALAPMAHDVGLPNKIYDYFARGKPTIISAHPGLKQTFGGGCAVFFQPGNEVDLADRILQLFHDPKERAALSSKSRLYYQKCQWSVTRQVYLNVHTKMLSTSASAAKPGLTRTETA